MATFFSMVRDINGYNGFGLQPPDYVYNATLAQSTATALTVPAAYGKWLAIFSYEPGGACWVADNHTAAVPAGATFAATTSVLLPVSWQVNGGDVLSFITPDTSCAVGVAFYALS